MNTVLFFLPDLLGGGAQRTVVNIVNHLDPQAFKSVLVVGSASGPYRDMVRGGTQVVDLGQRRVRTSIIPLSREIPKHKPGLLFSAYPDGNVALMLARSLSRWRCPIVLRESNHRTAQDVKWGHLKTRAVSWSYRRADRVVALSNGVREDVISRYGLRRDKVVTIHNPVDIEFIRRLASECDEGMPIPEKECFRIISAGRLVRQKGFDILIRAVAELKGRDVQLTILGEGEDHEALLRLATEVGIGDRLYMAGFRKNPYVWMRNSDLFVLSSRWEGFGHVIVEAMVCGLPVVASHCLSGPDEIITHGANGLLCEPECVGDMAEKIRFMLEKPDERARLSVAGEASAHRFEAKSIAREYEMLFKSHLD